MLVKVLGIAYSILDIFNPLGDTAERDDFGDRVGKEHVDFV